MKVTKEKLVQFFLGVFAIWAVGMGMVISGEFFGWNLGLAITGPSWFFMLVAVVALIYFGLFNINKLSLIFLVFH